MSGVRARHMPLGTCKMAASSALVIALLIAPSAQGARLFRSPEPHLPEFVFFTAENLPSQPAAPSVSERQPSSDAAPSLHPDAAISLPRSAAASRDADDYFAPGSWRPVRDPDVISASGRRRISPLATTGFSGDMHIASGRNLRHEDGEGKVPSEARTSETSSGDTPTSTLGHSIALVANQLLQSKSDILESHVPEITVTGATKDEGRWPSASLDMRTPPKLMLQISGQKNGASDEEDADKKVVPIQDDPMGENFFPSRRQPTTVTTPSPPTTPGQFVTQMMVSTMKKNQTKESSLQAPAPTPGNNKVDRRPITMTSASSTITNRKSSPTLATITRTTPLPSTAGSTIFSSITPPQPPMSTSVKWKIAIPPNRPVTRFPPRKPANATTTTTSPPVTSKPESNKKENKPSSTIGSFNPKPSVGGITKPYGVVSSSRRPTSTITRVTTTTTPQPRVTTTSRATVAVPTRSTFVPTSRPPTTTTSRQPVRATTPKPVVATTSRPLVSAPSKPSPAPSTTEAPKKESQVVVQERKPVMSEREPAKEAVTTAATKVDVTTAKADDTTTASPPSSTPRPRRPSNKRKKNKNKKRRRRPAKKPDVTTEAPLSGTELEVKETPQDDVGGNVASPLSTRIYNFIAREVMPSMSVGLLGLVVTAGLAGYFLLPTLGLQRRSDAANGGGSYGLGSGGQDDDGGIVQTIFQNVMASVSNGEKEFERGPRRRRSVVTPNEAENEIAAGVNIKERDENWQQTNAAETTTTPSSDVTTAFSPENPTVLNSDTDSQKEASTSLPESTDQIQTTTEGTKNNNNPTHAMTPTYGWEGVYSEYPLTLSGILRRIAEFKLRIGVSLLRATTDVIARYLQDVQQRLRDSDKQDWLRNLESTISRIRRSIDTPHIKPREKETIPHPKSRFSRQHRSKRHG